MTRATFTIATIILMLCTTAVALADTFGSGANQFDIEFVPIGNPNNPDDTTGSPNPVGKVEYSYRMGKYEISRDMITKANNEGGLGIVMNTMSFTIGGPRDDMPALGVNWLEAATFINWLNTSTGHAPAYKFSGNTFALWQPGDAGYNPDNLFRNDLAFYFLPSVDEWYKAAYYDPTSGVYYDYATGSNSVPTPVGSGTTAGTAVYNQPVEQGPADITLAGGLSPYGTMSQGGNAPEWEETEFDLVNDSVSARRGRREGAGWWEVDLGDLNATSRGMTGPESSDNIAIGFRVASVVPEPSSTLLGALAIGALAIGRRRLGQVK